jgi:hypothetical protein
MTSFAFIFGVVPLLLGTGAGAEMRRTLGVAVFSGMLGVTLFGIFLTPVFFNVIEWFIDRRLAESPGAMALGHALLLPLHALRVAVVWPASRWVALRAGSGTPPGHPKRVLIPADRTPPNGNGMPEDAEDVNLQTLITHVDREAVEDSEKSNTTEPTLHAGAPKPNAFFPDS